MTKFKTLFNYIAAFFPTKLPVGMTEFMTWSDSIISLSGKFANEDSMRFAIASMVIHLPQTRSSMTKRYFVSSLRKSAANQVASQVFQDIKLKQTKEAEDSAKLAVESNGQPTQTA